MKKILNEEEKKELNQLCHSARTLIYQGHYYDCERLIYDAMSKYPHAPEPHNLLGILFEVMNEHLVAMKHFRAAIALDPTYLPAIKNLNCLGTSFFHKHYSYDESDCIEKKCDQYKVEYDEHGIGHVKRRV